MVHCESKRLHNHDRPGSCQGKMVSVMELFQQMSVNVVCHVQMVLIVPRIKADGASPYGGVLTVSFPVDSGCEAFSVPLSPTKDVLDGWKG